MRIIYALDLEGVTGGFGFAKKQAAAPAPAQPQQPPVQVSAPPGATVSGTGLGNFGNVTPGNGNFQQSGEISSDDD